MKLNNSGFILLISCLTTLAACSSPSLTTHPTIDRSAGIDTESNSSIEPDDAAITPSFEQFSSNDIRAVLAQGDIEESRSCPSSTAEGEESLPLEKVAYFETTDYWMYICADEHRSLHYYGRKRDDPAIDITLPASANADAEYVAQNGNTTYWINANELVVMQNDVPIIREPVLFWSDAQTLRGYSD